MHIVATEGNLIDKYFFFFFFFFFSKKKKKKKKKNTLSGEESSQIDMVVWISDTVFWRKKKIKRSKCLFKP